MRAGRRFRAGSSVGGRRPSAGAEELDGQLAADVDAAGVRASVWNPVRNTTGGEAEVSIVTSR